MTGTARGKEEEDTHDNIHGILLQNIPTGLELFWNDFQKKTNSE